MTQTDQASSKEASATIPAASERLASVMARLAHAVDHELTAGDVAELRRLRPNDPGSVAFWKVLATYLDPAEELPRGGDARHAAERNWAAILSGMAVMRGLHRHGHRPGHALASGGYSELRFVRLLRARDAALLDAVRGVAQFLSSKGEAVDWLQLARLIKQQEGEGAERLRRDIARDFYGAHQKGEH